MRHYTEKKLKNLLQVEGGRWFIVGRRVGDVDQFVSHDWAGQGVERRKSNEFTGRDNRALLIQPRRGPRKSCGHKGPKNGRGR